MSCRDTHRTQTFFCHMSMSIVRRGPPRGIPIFAGETAPAALHIIGVMNVSQRVAHTHGFAVMKNRGKQALASKWHAAKPFLSFCCYSDGGGQVKQVSF